MSEETFRWIVAGGVLIAALCIMVQAAIVIALFSVVKKVQAKTNDVIERTEPIVDSVRAIVSDLRPKIALVSSDVVDAAKIGKQQAERIADLVGDFSERAKLQVARIDSKVDDTVDQVQSATDAAREVFLKPVREVDGIFSGIRAAMSVYTRPRKSSVDHATQDEEMFI